MTIDWIEIADGYGQRVGRRITVKRLLEEFYEAYGSLDMASEKIGVSTPTLKKKMQELKVHWKKISRQETMKEKILGIPQDRMKDMTAEEIRKYAGYAHVTAVHAILRTYNRNHKYARPEDSRETIFKNIYRRKLEAMTLQEICQRVGIAKATAYRFCSQYNILYKGSRMRRK